jgi:hypothetical protein
MVCLASRWLPERGASVLSDGGLAGYNGVAIPTGVLFGLCPLREEVCRRKK